MIGDLTNIEYYERELKKMTNPIDKKRLKDFIEYLKTTNFSIV